MLNNRVSAPCPHGPSIARMFTHVCTAVQIYLEAMIPANNDKRNGHECVLGTGQIWLLQVDFTLLGGKRPLCSGTLDARKMVAALLALIHQH
jgi:hypothetical protein